MRRIQLLVLLGLALWCQTLALAGAPARVVVVHSYNPEYVWTQNISLGIQEALHGLKPDITTLYLDAKRTPEPEVLRQHAEEILQQIEALAPQVVIAADDAAQQYLVAPHLKGRAAPQVIFCGVNAPLNLYGFPAANVSGVRERWHTRESIALMQRIVPKARSFAFLTDDSESSQHVLNDLRKDMRKGSPYALRPVAVEAVGTFQQWQSKVRSYQKKADALAVGIYHSLRDERTGLVVPPETVSAWTASANRLPTIGFTDYAVEHGLLCGVLESAHEQGWLAGQLARIMLEQGVAAGTLPVRINKKGIVMLNLKTAERLGLIIPFEIISAAGLVVR